MTQPGTDPLHDLETRTRRNDPRFARELELRQPRRPRADRGRRGLAWALLAVSVLMVITGMLLPQGLLLAAGLVAAGTAAHLLALAPAHDPGRPGHSFRR
jgi:hypothetical protein